ncbi:sterol desaturase family protein [Rapidithrix thailandica]|uniref:Sterol desaturase family protein n=1 Tax=Rapidithrix thailandica TaxID=413964 RepID=A0AAW9S0R0_9BACT
MASTSNQQKGKMFENPFLDRLTRTHISIPLIIFYGTAIGVISYASIHHILSWWQIVLSFLVGFIFFTWIEYIAHRYLYHMETDSPVKADLQHKLHGLHHDYPNDKGRLAMPPFLAALLAVGFFYLFNFIMGSWAYGFLPGFISGYAAYLSVHYIVHAFRPPNNALKILWVNHGIHHYKAPDKAFGVSSPLWDYIYRTMP